VARITIRRGVNLVDHAGAARGDRRAESLATTPSMPVPTNGASRAPAHGLRCMFEPINARLASSF